VLQKLAGWTLLAGVAIAPAWAATATGKAAAARAQFGRAERLRASLNSHAADARTRREYQRVIAAYRRVYYLDPVSKKADPSVGAAADLLAQMGRQFHDAGALNSAVEQYQFLRHQYPGSARRADALFAIGRIYKEDLHDPVRAREAFAGLVKQYPRGRLAKQANDALAELANSEKAWRPGPREGAAGRNRRGAVARVTGIRQWSTADSARVAIALDKRVEFDSRRTDNPESIVFDLQGARLAALAGKPMMAGAGVVKAIRASQLPGHRVRLVLQVDGGTDYSAFLLDNPARLIVDVHGKTSAAAETASSDDDEDATETAAAPTGNDGGPAEAETRDSAEPAKSTTGVERRPGKAASLAGAEAGGRDPGDTPKIVISDRPVASGRAGRNLAARTREAKPTASGDRSLIRALGLKIGRIVIDPGHGGHDTGTIGARGLQEKDVVLDVGLRLGDLLASRLGSEVVYTREDDTFIPLESRTAMANRQRADLFVSIHANASADPDARGVETYYLNFTSSPSALEVAARENAASQKSIHELQDLVKKIALKDKIEESREFATDVQQALHLGLGSKSPAIRDRGVKKAPFVVLIGANMPSILAEISFVSNPSDEHNLERAAWRQQIAESLYRGIARYVGGLSGVKVASRGSSRQGQ
jgi:N-acetylmuramoyl-L-alanine amidase